MLKGNRDKAPKDSISVQGSTTSEKQNKGIWATVITIILVAVIIVAVFSSAFFLIIHNNINGLGERYRQELKGIPLIKLALPTPADPLDPKNLTAEELKEKYLELRKQNAELASQLDDSNKKVEDLSGIEADYERIKSEEEKAKTDIQAQQTALDQEKNKIDEYKQQVDAIVARGDTAEFKQFYEQLDPEVAKQVYSEIIVQQVTDENVKKFAQIYETMDSSSAAQIFEKMGSTKIDMIAETLVMMKKESSSAILAAMTPAFASKMTEKLNALYKGK